MFKKRLYRARLFLSTITIVTVLSGCIPQMPRLSQGDSGGTGSIQLLATAPTSVESGQISDVKVIFSLGSERSRREMFLNQSESGFTGHIEIPVGDWEVTIYFYDLDGDIRYSSQGLARVRGGQTATLQLEAVPHNGYLEVEVDISPVFTEEEVNRVRIELPTNHRTSLTVSPTNPHVFTGSRTFPPGDHDFAFALYKDGDSSAHKVYESPWEQVRIEPGKTISIEWSPETGMTHIATRPINMPKPPSGLMTEEIEEDTVQLHWQPSPSPDVDFYRIYLKRGDIGNFSSVAEVETTEWTITPNLLTGYDTFSFAVTTVNTYGHESFRTEPTVLWIASE